MTGSLQPDETATVSNEIAGRLGVLHADFGQRVRQGQVVAELDKRELQLQLDRMNAVLAQTLNDEIGFDVLGDDGRRHYIADIDE